MKLSDLLTKVEEVHRSRSNAPMSSLFGEMVKGWLVSGVSVAAIFDRSSGQFIQVTPSEHEAKARAVGYRNSGMDVCVKRIKV